MTRHCHPSATLIEPYQQGRLDSLCGLYALINAMRLIYADTAPLTGQSSKRLFAEGMDFLTAKMCSRDAPQWGMTAGRQRKLAKALFKCEVLVKRPKLRHGPPAPPMASPDQLQSAIETVIADGGVLLACFQGRISHHSVIIGQTATRVLLFDSDGMRFVQKASIRFSEGHHGTLTLHAIAPLSLAVA